MYKTSKPLFLFCETPLHAGSGSDLGIIDMPIQRERHTGYPKIESSSLKGSLREAFEKSKATPSQVQRVFGFDDWGSFENLDKDTKQFFADKKDREFSGCLALTDARILLFPVKSQKGVFAWITCPRVISRFISEMKEYCKIADIDFDTLVEGSTGTNSQVVLNNKVGLEEYIFDNITPDTNVTKLGQWIASKLFKDPTNNYWAKKMATDIVVIKDEDFADFVQYSTEVITRTKIDNETGTVSNSALFTEEYLPSESVMYSLAMFAPEFSGKKGKMTEIQVEQFFQTNLPEVFQIGGNATLGKGIVRTKPKPE